MARYICQLRRGTKDEWKTYEDSKYVQAQTYSSSLTYYSDKNGTVANPQPTTQSNITNGVYYIQNPQYIAPLEGELVLEYDENKVPRLKIGNGVDDYSALPYLSTDSFVLPTYAYVELPSDKWVLVSENRWGQEATVHNAVITECSKVDLQPDVEQLSIFYKKDIAFVTENEGGKVTVFCIGQKPIDNYTIQATVTEVAITSLLYCKWLTISM